MTGGPLQTTTISGSLRIVGLDETECRDRINHTRDNPQNGSTIHSVVHHRSDGSEPFDLWIIL
jgi:hypothetical protein